MVDVFGVKRFAAAIEGPKMQLKVLCCGSRDWTDRETISRVLSGLPMGTIIVHGACEKGADALVHEEAVAMSLGEKRFLIAPYPADWDGYAAKGQRNAAGPARNSKMIREEHPDKFGVLISEVFAFTNNLERSRGTYDMVKKARAAGIKVNIVRTLDYGV